MFPDHSRISGAILGLDVLFLGALLWLKAIDVIRHSKAFEVGHCGVSQQLQRLCPHSFNFMMGWDEKKPERAPEREREREREREPQHQRILIVKLKVAQERRLLTTMKI